MNRILQVGTTDTIDIGVQKYNSFSLAEMPSVKVTHFTCISCVHKTAWLKQADLEIL